MVAAPNPMTSGSRSAWVMGESLLLKKNPAEMIDGVEVVHFNGFV
jgi:hypothetical protein